MNLQPVIDMIENESIASEIPIERYLTLQFFCILIVGRQNKNKE